MGFANNYNHAGFQLDRFGLITGTFALSRLPDVECSIYRFFAPASNVGLITLGNKYNTGSANAFLPLRLAAGDDTGWNTMTSEFGFNLNGFYQKGASGTSAVLIYWIQR